MDKNQQPPQQQSQSQPQQDKFQIKEKQPTIIPSRQNNKLISGDVRFGKGCIVNQDCYFKVDEGAGPIIIGDYNIFEEKCYIHNKLQKDGSVKTLRIGSYNMFEQETLISTSCIGDCNTFEHRCQIDRNCSIPSGCVVGATVKLLQNVSLQDQVKVLWPEILVKDNQFDAKTHQLGMKNLYEAYANIFCQESNKLEFLYSNNN